MKDMEVIESLWRYLFLPFTNLGGIYFLFVLKSLESGKEYKNMGAVEIVSFKRFHL